MFALGEKTDLVERTQLGETHVSPLKKRPTFIEAYGKTVTDYANAHRRGLNVDGLSSLDFEVAKIKC